MAKITTQIPSISNIGVPEAPIDGNQYGREDASWTIIETTEETPDATTILKGKIKLVGDLGGTADLPTVPGLSLKENTANKQNSLNSDGTGTKFPTVDATRKLAESTINFNKEKITQPTLITAGSVLTATAIPTGTTYTFSNSVFKYSNGYAAQAGTTYPNTTFARGFHVTGTAHQAGFNVEFYTDAPEFELYFFNNNTGSFRILVDGVVAYTLSSYPTTSSGLVYQKFTLAVTSTKKITIEGGGYFFFGSIKVPAGYTLSNQTELIKKPRAIFLSDSFGEPSGTSRWNGWIYKAGNYLNWDAWASGSGGTGYVNSGIAGRFKFADRLNSDVIAYSPDIVVIAGGINDANYSVSSFETQVNAVFLSVKTNLPKAKVYILGNWRPKQINYSPWDNISAVLEKKCAEYGFAYIDTRNWFTGEGNAGSPTGEGNADYYIQADGIHPTVAGYDYLGRKVTTAIQNLAVGDKAANTFAQNLLTGYVSGAGTVLETDTVLQAIQKLNGNTAFVQNSIPSQATFSPTVSAETNLTSTTVSGNYTVNNGLVTAYVRISSNITNASTASSFNITLPVNRTTTNTLPPVGSGSIGGGVILPVKVKLSTSGNNLATINFVSGAGSGVVDGNVSFQYRVTE